MKQILLFCLNSILIAINGQFVYGQNDIKTNHEFMITITYFNHAERVFEGYVTYELTKSRIKVFRRGILEKKFRLECKRKVRLSPGFIDSINVLRLDTLSSSYINFCVMISSGDEYIFNINSELLNKSISLHHYYLCQIEWFVKFFNKFLPARHKLRYLNSKTEQGCKPLLL